MLRGLPGFGQIREQIARVIGRFDLGEANISRDNCEDIVEIVRDAAGQSAKRFQLAHR